MLTLLFHFIAWRSSRAYVNEQIRRLRSQLHELKEIRSHLKAKRPGQYQEINPGQYFEFTPGQYEEIHPGQYPDILADYSENFDSLSLGQYDEIHPGQYKESDIARHSDWAHYDEIHPGQYQKPEFSGHSGSDISGRHPGIQYSSEFIGSVNLGQYDEIHPGQYQESNPRQYFEENATISGSYGSTVMEYPAEIDMDELEDDKDLLGVDEVLDEKSRNVKKCHCKSGKRYEKLLIHSSQKSLLYF